MLRRLELTNFKAFERFTVYLRGDVFLVGPNNAGKSTLIAALRAGANMLRIANRRRATDSDEVDGSIRHGHRFTAEQIGLVQENLRHEFHQIETRMVWSLTTTRSSWQYGQSEMIPAGSSMSVIGMSR
jgi:predicted ATP-dependent endonuclease of OLD family